jgi:Cu-Zn family superoxide dismutase
MISTFIKTSPILFFALLFVLPIYAVTKTTNPPNTSLSAIAVISPTSTSNVHGIVKFSPTAKGVRVVADISGLAPGVHGFHIHEWGDISSQTGESAGPHFNPDKTVHGGPNTAKHHEGDLGNIEADANGNAHLDAVHPSIQLFGEKSIIGRSVVVHEDEDDLNSQPAGNAGGRLGVGVIGIKRK